VDGYATASFSRFDCYSGGFEKLGYCGYLIGGMHDDSG
jgi:hypothetical protein